MERNKNLWIYNAGSSFSGNPKWMFLYMMKKHPDVKGVWLTYDFATTKYIRGLGYEAYLFKSPAGKSYMKKAGVYVVNQVKEIIQPELLGITMLNLWHGVGCKTVEQKVNFGFLRERIIKKYIQNNKFYKQSQLFLVTSELMEEHFIKQCGLSENQLVRAGYPCCQKMDWVCSFDHDIKKKKGLSDETKIAMYCPTYRDGNQIDFFGSAIPDMDRLINVLEKNDILLIMKLHPQMINDSKYVAAKEKYSNCKNILFWDNMLDIYEIFDCIDIAIIDYSSIFYDLLAAGVPHYIRYMFDIDDKENLRDFVFDVKEMTCGDMCDNFDMLLEALEKKSVNCKEDNNAASIDKAYIDNDEIKKREEIKKLFWSYDENSCENIYDKAMQHKVMPVEDKILYSYDIFDTILNRKCLSPVGIFAYVSQKMNMSQENFPEFVKAKYRYVRMGSEANAREYVKKSLHVRKDARTEITFDQIFERMESLYKLSKKQIELLKQWELEAEYKAAVLNTDIAEEIKNHIADGDKVVFISDMYLPKDFIAKLIHKIEPEFDEVPLYVSSELGSQKTTKQLYLDVFNDLDKYDYTEWIHTGDNPNADQKQPEQLGILCKQVNKLNWEKYEQQYLTANFTYDAYCCAAIMRRLKELTRTDKEYNDINSNYWDITINNVSSWLVPYVAWVIDDAVKKELDTLYFISRDGHLLKLIADEIINNKKLNIKTKYIYGSRKLWRIPSFVEDIDKDFFEAHGQFADISDFSSLLGALLLDEKQFDEILPELNYVKSIKYIKSDELKKIRETLKNSEAYRSFVLEKSKEQRPIVLKYLKQQIDFTEKYAFVEYWGRGYTQECLGRLLREINTNATNEFYYIRSIYFSDETNIRYNMSNDTGSLIMVEAVFANTPYKTISEYRDNNGIVEPVIEENEFCNKALQKAIEKGLFMFTRQMCDMDMVNEEMFYFALSQFGISHYRKNNKAKVYVNVLAKMIDSVSVNGKCREFAPPIRLKDVYMKLRYNEYIRTRNINISVERSNRLFKTIYKLYRKRKNRG